MADASAPASSANLGPGFDTIALALEIRCAVSAEPSASWEIEHIGGEALPAADDAVLAAARRAVGEDAPLRLAVESDIPLARGLGSSAAAFTAGAVAAWRTIGTEPDPMAVFDLVADLEGHPDNAAAAVFGGLVGVTADRTPIDLTFHPSLVPVVAVPAWSLSTTQARAVLPDTIDRKTAVRAVQRAISLVEGLRTGDPGLLKAAGGDELHERPRAGVNPIADRLIAAAQTAGALHACWSGAGPSVLALATSDTLEEVRAAMDGILEGEGDVLMPEVSQHGFC